MTYAKDNSFNNEEEKYENKKESLTTPHGILSLFITGCQLDKTF